MRVKFGSYLQIHYQVTDLVSAKRHDRPLIAIIGRRYILRRSSDLLLYSELKVCMLIAYTQGYPAMAN